MTNQELHDLLEYFGQEHACYTSLLDLSRRQRGLIEDGDIDRLMEVLGQKQRILTTVEGIEERLSPYKQEWTSLREGLDEDDRQVLDLALSTVEELLAELIDLEKKSEQLLADCRDETQRQLSEAVRGNAVHRAYTGKEPENPARYFDIWSE